MGKVMKSLGFQGVFSSKNYRNGLQMCNITLIKRIHGLLMLCITMFRDPWLYRFLNLRGSPALDCLSMTLQKINYALEVDKVCKALEAVNLKSSEILDHPNTQICNEGRQKALVEILEILTVVCEIHKLPLAQTGVPCVKSCSSFDGSCMERICMSTTEVAFYVVDAHMWGFRVACAEHHLQKGQGDAGLAFASHNSCFCEDITQFCKTEYPLVHYARMFGLASSFAICLWSTHTRNDDYILEFFLPPHIRDRRDQQTLLDSILVTMKPHFWSLLVASGKELEEEGRCIEMIKHQWMRNLTLGSSMIKYHKVQYFLLTLRSYQMHQR